MCIFLKGFEIMIILDDLKIEMTGFRKEMEELAGSAGFSKRREPLP